MAKQAAKRAPQADEGGIVLNPFELLDLVKAGHAVEISRARLESVQNARVAIEAQVKLALAEINTKLEEVRAAEAEANKAYKTLAGDIAERYHFDWETHSFCNETGAVRQITEG